GYPDTALDDSLGDGVTGETGDVVDIELAHEILPVFVNRLEAETQFRGDLLVGFAFGNQLEHLHLAGTEAVAFLLELPFPIERLPGTIVNAPGDGRAEKCFSFLDLANRRGEIV